MSSKARRKPNGQRRCELEETVERVNRGPAAEGHRTLTPALLALGLHRGRELRSEAFSRTLARLFGRS